MRNGGIFEQARVNVSHVHGDAMPASATAHRPDLADARWRMRALHRRERERH
ncbi:hypothetical protein [Salmonella enterica]|uniref:hypothetical protein n=1 Tax=Salmonella enterica TaxID=28901 RepID=UPI000A554D0E